MSQSNNEIHEILVPPQHALIELIDANETYLFGSRGSFKSSVGLSLFNIRRVFEMPRSTGVGVGISFNNLYENTVPPFKAFLLSKGFVEDIHFTICKPPPKNWPTPYMGVVDKKYANTMTWYNGTVKQFISLRRKASANGVSAQWGDFDEVKFMNSKVLSDEIFPIFRGNEKHFRKCSGYLSKFFLTDKNEDPVKIDWLLKKRNLVNPGKIDIIITLQLEVDRLKAEYNQATKTRKAELAIEINAIEVRLSVLRSNAVYVSEIGADDVRPILGNKWYKDKQRNSTQREWKIIYKNEDPDRPGETFYPAWSEDKHCYEALDDIDPNEPFIISSDYQHTIAPIPIAQLAKLPGRDTVSLNFVDEEYTIHPEGLRAAVKKFCSRYKDHPVKCVYYVYDHTAIGGRVDAIEVYKIVIDELENNDWTVWEIYTGQAPGHYQKYTDSMAWLNEEKKEDDTFEETYAIRLNKRRCKKLPKSIKDARARTISGETKKDKRPETDDEADQSETTHFSDAFDMILDAVLKQKLITEGVASGGYGFGR